jgi:hypothetical protein
MNIRSGLPMHARQNEKTIFFFRNKRLTLQLLFGGRVLGLRPPGGKQMDKKIAGLLGAAAALTTMSAAQSAIAEPTQNTPPTSYRDLLEPIPDALNALKIDDARIAAAKTQGGEQVAQYYYHHHHHHHHHRYYRIVPRRYYHHHHHHHHHHHGGFGIYIR